MYKYKDKYTLDFSQIKYFGDIHKVIKNELDFPDYYGENWDAFWDCLTDMVGRAINIEIIGLDRAYKLFGKEAEMICSILKELKHWNNEKYSSQIKIEIVCTENTRYEIM